MKTKNLILLHERARQDIHLHQGLASLSGADEEDVLVAMILFYSEERERLVKIAVDGEMRRPIHYHISGLELRRDDD